MAAALISALTEIHRFGGTLLIVCPKQVKGTWRREANVFGPIEPRLQSCTQIFQDAKPGIFITSKASSGKSYQRTFRSMDRPSRHVMADLWLSWMRRIMAASAKQSDRGISA